MIKFIAVLFFSLFVSACSCVKSTPLLDGGSITRNGRDLYWVDSDFPLYVIIDDTMFPDYIEDTILAVDTWNHELEVPAFYPILSSNVIYQPRSGYINVTMQDLRPNYNGLHEGHVHEDTEHMKMSNVWLDVELFGEEILIVATHELGHALTLEHDHDHRSVMHPNVLDMPNKVYIMPDDVERIRRMILEQRVQLN